MKLTNHNEFFQSIFNSLSLKVTTDEHVFDENKKYFCGHQKYIRMEREIVLSGLEISVWSQCVSFTCKSQNAFGNCVTDQTP